MSGSKSLPIAIGQIATHPGDISANVDKILCVIKEAVLAKAKVVVFPELTIPGYAAMDLFYLKNYRKENLKALDEIREAAEDIVVVVGFVEEASHKLAPGEKPFLYNSIAIIENKKILGVQRKRLLPTYGIFDEARYFQPGEGSKIFSVSGKRIGFEICEDLWSEGYDLDVTSDLSNLGAEVIVNSSASPFHVGRFGDRVDLLNKANHKTKCPFIYANLVGSYDGFDGEIIFDGRSIIMSAGGAILALGKAFEEDMLVADIYSEKALTIKATSETEELFQALVLGISEYFKRIEKSSGLKSAKAVVGISGGIDSAVVAALAVEALGNDKVVGITMPSHYTSNETKADAERLAANLGIQIYTVPIEEQYFSMISNLRKEEIFNSIPEGSAEENIQARIRMIILMYYANQLGGIVLNTGNKTELALDNCTIYGDMVGGFSVLGDVDKIRIYDLARYINNKSGRELIVNSVISRTPTAELKPNQTDATVMGAEPQEIAPLANALVEENISINDAVSDFGSRYSRELIERTWTRLDRSEWKRRQASPGIRVTTRAFGIGRRMPMNHGFKN